MSEEFGTTTAAARDARATGDQSAEFAAPKEATDTRVCTCYPGEGPLPCPRKFALRDCWRAAVLEETQKNLVALKNRDRQPHEQRLLNFLMRVRTALELETSEFPPPLRATTSAPGSPVACPPSNAAVVVPNPSPLPLAQASQAAGRCSTATAWRAIDWCDRYPLDKNDDGTPNKRGEYFFIEGPDDLCIAQWMTAEQAAFIVRACNAHDDLVAALRNLSNEVLGTLPLMEPLARQEFGNTNYNILIQRAEEARAALARVNQP